MDPDEVIKNILAHYGVKGQKWGVRKNQDSSVTVTSKRKKLKTSGGAGRPTHADAKTAATIGQIRKKSGAKALSNQELQAYAQRLRLEQEVKRLDSQKSPAKSFITRLLGQQGNSAANQVAGQATTLAVKKSLSKTPLAAA
jgi:hypothetical protein